MTRGKKLVKVGWVIGDLLDRPRLFARRRMGFGGSSLARFVWLGDYVNSRPELGARYELYSRWRGFDALLFQKSMGERSMDLLRRAQSAGRAAIFDANVNYYERRGAEYYENMLPSEKQMEDAKQITSAADGVIADSEFLAGVCGRFNDRVRWIPDSVNMDIVPSWRRWRAADGRLPLLWSGVSLKLFEILAIEKPLLKFADRVELVLVTNDLDALSRWKPGLKERFEALMAKVPSRIIPYRSVEELFEVYSRGGVAIAPRFLDNSYNMGHTEWKITLPMACGRMALCSPVPSYVKIHDRARGAGVRVLHDDAGWEGALEDLLSGRVDIGAEERAAREVVRKYYSTEVVAREHADFITELVNKR
ncbi:MAG: hypothetical protein ACNS63_01895 [Candidatus Nitrospinota bacterium M3_3B_026]